MGLASQSIRSGSRRSHMSRRRRRRPGRWIVLLLLVGIVAAGWWWFTAPPKTTDVATTTAPEATGTPSAPAIERTRPTTLDPVTRPRTTRPRPPRSTAPAVSSTEADPDPVSTTPPSTPPSTTPSTPPSTSTSGTAATTSDAPRKPAAAPSSTPATVKTTAPPRIAVRPAPPPTSAGAAALEEALDRAADDPLAARERLTDAWTRGLVGDDRQTAQLLSRRLADATLLVDARRSGSPYATPYRIKRGDAMSRIARRHDVNTNLDFVARINGIKDLNRIRENQEIWLPRGLFHLVVDRSEGDLAVHQEIDGRRHLLLVVPVAMGRGDLTPDLLFQVRQGSKRTNPSWTDPATGVRWAASDSRNPIGEFWIGLEPAEISLRGDPKYQGFGLHGTGPEIEFGAVPTSGSLQVREADAAILFELLRSGRSTVDVRP